MYPWFDPRWQESRLVCRQALEQDRQHGLCYVNAACCRVRDEFTRGLGTDLRQVREQDAAANA